jgi:hypothetical protein
MKNDSTYNISRQQFKEYTNAETKFKKFLFDDEYRRDKTRLSQIINKPVTPVDIKLIELHGRQDRLEKEAREQVKASIKMYMSDSEMFLHRLMGLLPT